MASKKIAPKKAPVKVVAKKTVAKPVAKSAKKTTPAKPVAKKVAVKSVAKKAVKKTVVEPVKKAAVKPTVKKVLAKSMVKKVEKKAVIKPAKKVVAKSTVKKVVEKPSAKKAVAKVVTKPAKAVVNPIKKAVVAKPISKKIEPKKLKAEVEKVVVKPEVKIEKPEKVRIEKVKKERKSKVKKPKRIIRTSKPPKPVKALGIEKATTVIPIKKIVVKVKEEPIKNFKVPKITTKSSVSYSPGYVPMDRRKEDEEPQAPVVRYTDVELNEFRELITKKIDNAKRELAYLQGVITRKDDGDSEDGRYMTMEDGGLSMEREQMSNMASRQVTYIDHLEKAIQRIDSKTYGICRVTGKLIDKARLRAVPHATLSLEAKLGLVKAGE